MDLHLESRVSARVVGCQVYGATEAWIYGSPKARVSIFRPKV